MKKRLRKKLHRGEFQELGFFLKVKYAEMPDEEFDRFIDFAADAAGQVEGRQLQSVELRAGFRAGRNAGIGADDQSGRCFLRDALRRNRVRRHHRIDVPVPDGAGEFLDVLTAEIQQHNGFRCLFHTLLPELIENVG